MNNKPLLGVLEGIIGTCCVEVQNNRGSWCSSWCFRYTGNVPFVFPALLHENGAKKLGGLVAPPFRLVELKFLHFTRESDDTASSRARLAAEESGYETGSSSANMATTDASTESVGPSLHDTAAADATANGNESNANPDDQRKHARHAPRGQENNRKRKRDKKVF